MNVWDWIILALIVAAVLCGVRRIRKKGGCCQDSCAACSQRTQCHHLQSH